MQPIISNIFFFRSKYSAKSMSTRIKAFAIKDKIKIDMCDVRSEYIILGNAFNVFV